MDHSAIGVVVLESSGLVPHTLRLARGGVLCTAAMILPYVLYTSVHGVFEWSPEQTLLQTVITALGLAGMFVGLAIAACCLFLDAKRRS